MNPGRSPASPRLPDFFVVGAPKAGTTSLNRYLEQHPEIYMSPFKEPHYFADETRVSNFSPELQTQATLRAPQFRAWLDGDMSETFQFFPVGQWDDYLKLFRRAGEAQLAGEASVCYLWSPTAAANIARTVPAARILVVLRNPIDRAFSQYLHTLGQLRSFVSFREYMDSALASTGTRMSNVYPFLEFGLYTAQLERYFALFPRERIHIGFYENYRADPAAFLQAIFRFLGVDEAFTPDFSIRYMEARVPRAFLMQWVGRDSALWRTARSALPSSLRSRLRGLIFRSREQMRLEPADRARLADWYRDDVHKLSRLLGRDLSGWLSPAGSGMGDVPTDRRSGA